MSSTCLASPPRLAARSLPLLSLSSLSLLSLLSSLSLLVLPMSACGSVAQPGGCMVNADCTGNPNGSICNATTRRCVICYQDASCEPGQRCDVSGNRCVACLGDADCRAGELCDVVAGACRPGCTAERRCAEGSVCHLSEGKGICVQCLTSADCRTGRCDPTIHTCVDCLQDTDCNPGNVCRANRCTPGCSAQQVCPAPRVCDLSTGACVDCTSDVHCKAGSAPRCDVRSNRCVECLTGSDNCPIGQYCAANQCYTGCRNDTDCKVGSPSPASQGKARCLVAKNACVACVAASDCPQGYICAQDNTCTIGCINDSNCGAGQSCCNGQCQAINTKANCGTCGRACGSGEDCCGAACIKVTTTQNCGGCGIACAAGQSCCAQGCANLLTDATNCGACGIACAAGQICCAGSCRTPTTPGACVDCTKPCSSYEVKGAGFANGTFDQLKVTQDGLQTVPGAESPPPARTPWVWIAMHNSNQINQLDANTGSIIRTVASSGSGPSRGAQALDGSFWYGNRCEGDPNNPSCSNVGQVLPDGTRGCVVGRAADGQVLPFVRALAIDRDGFVWAGTWNDYRVHKIDPNTCKTVRDLQLAKSGANSYPYGLAIDSKGILWNSDAGASGYWMGVNTATGAIDYVVAHGSRTSYGVVIDRKDNVYFAQWNPCSAGLWRVDAATQAIIDINPSQPANYCVRGLTVDTDGNVWAAIWLGNGTSWVSKFAGGSGAFIGSYSVPNVGNGVGIAGDTFGNVWLTGQSGNNVVRWNRAQAGVANGQPLKLDFTTALVGSNPYNYSDWNGVSIRTVTSNNAQAGTWALAFDGGTPTVRWSSAAWTATTPRGTAVKLRFRAATSFGNLATAPACGPFLASPADLATCNFGQKQWLQASIELTTADVNAQPVVSSLRVYFQPN